jgi:hypothetical protein
MNVKETILEQHRTLQRVRELQEEMHEICMFSAGLEEIGLVDLDPLMLMSIDTVHKISHALEDVLDGEDAGKALRKHLTGGRFEEDEE